MSDDTLLTYITGHPWRLLIYTGTSALGWLIAMTIRSSYLAWKAIPCHSGHTKKFLRLQYFTNIDCEEHGRHTEDGWWSTWAYWICTVPGCNSHGRDCYGEKAWWKIEHSQVVLDEKHMTSPPTDGQTPKQAVNEEKKRRGQGGMLTFDDVFKAAEQAILKNAQKAFSGVEGKDYGVQKQSMCDCGCECDPQFTAGLGELPRPKCDPLRHPQHHDLDVIASAKKKWAEEQKAKVCYAVKAKIDEKKKGESNAT